MTSTLLDQPILNLAIDNLSQLNNIDEKELSTIWNLFTKCKNNLENGYNSKDESNSIDEDLKIFLGDFGIDPAIKMIILNLLIFQN